MNALNIFHKWRRPASALVATIALGLTLSACSNSNESDVLVDDEGNEILEVVKPARKGTWSDEFPDTVFEGSFVKIQALNPEDTVYAEDEYVIDSAFVTYVDILSDTKDSFTISSMKFDDVMVAKEREWEYIAVYTDGDDDPKPVAEEDNCKVYNDLMNEGDFISVWRARTAVYVAQSTEKDLAVRVCAEFPL